MFVSGNQTTNAREHGNHCLTAEEFTVTDVELLNALMRQ